jgi:hypothetical protein
LSEPAATLVPLDKNLSTAVSEEGEAITWPKKSDEKAWQIRVGVTFENPLRGLSRQLRTRPNLDCTAHARRVD